MSIMGVIYILIIIMGLYQLGSPKVDTSNFLNLFGIGFFIVGALLDLYSEYKPLANVNNLFEIGIFLRFIYGSFFPFHRKGKT